MAVCFRLFVSRVSSFRKRSAGFPNFLAVEENSERDIAAHVLNADDRASPCRNGNPPTRYSVSFEHHKQVIRLSGSDYSENTVIFDEAHLPSATTAAASAHAAQRNLWWHFEPRIRLL